MPRFRPDGSVNALHFVRLKDKLGNRSNASSEVEFHSAHAERVGEEGAGVRTIIEMVQLTRLDCALASAGQMRMGLAQAVHHTMHRSVFERRLIDQPAMRAVLADLALESEANTALVFRLTQAFDAAAEGDAAEAAYTRLLTPAIKYLVCKTVPHFVYEALECLGGNGYVEDLPMARLYREAPLNAIWEGSGNVMALDILRAAQRAPEATIDVIERLAGACGSVGRQVAAQINQGLKDHDAERQARAIAEKLSRLAALAALYQGDAALAEAYATTRLSGEPHMTWGARNLAAMEDRLLERVLLAA
jgi:putative acyl-CoA dehydrogenase